LPVEYSLAEADVVQDLVGAAAGIAMGHAVEIAGEGHELDALEHRHDRGGLGHVADAAAQLARRVADVAAEDRAVSGVGLEQTEQHFQERALAGAVVADQSDRAGSEREADRAQGLHAAEVAADIANVDDLHAGNRGGWAGAGGGVLRLV
jgi:hypothetical protein